MNTRFLTTARAWFGGGADLNPPLPYEADTRDFHEAMQTACDAHGASYYERYKAWADDYFYIPHRQVHRGVGGIFCDHLECPDVAAWEANFAFIQDIGRALLEIFPQLVRRAWRSHSRPKTSCANSNGAGAMPNSTWSTIAARCSG